jgi:hypothetical protein
VRRERRNISGQAYGLTALFPIDDGLPDELTRHLDALPSGDASPLARVHGTHFARWVIIGDVVHEGDGQRPDHLRAARLLFTSNFDGPLERHLEGLRTGLAEDADAIWGHCRGYPGRGDGGAFAAWLGGHRVPSALFFAAYAEQSVGEVHANLELRTRLVDFALHAQGLAPDELRSRFRERFPL